MIPGQKITRVRGNQADISNCWYRFLLPTSLFFPDPTPQKNWPKKAPHPDLGNPPLCHQWLAVSPMGLDTFVVSWGCYL